jgi:hypothetical protein
MALNVIQWQVLDDASGSDHLSILTSFQSINVPTNIPVHIFDLTRHTAWSNYSESVLESLQNFPRTSDLAKRYDIFVDIIRESAMGAQTRSPQRCLFSSAINVVWWDGECDRLNDAKLVAFREKNGTSYNYENYLILERV